MKNTSPYLRLLFIVILFCFGSCKEDSKNSDSNTNEQQLTIFFVNDVHGQINNFAKIKHIVDEAKEDDTNVLVVCGGDIFSGNPIVDQYNEKGYPIIDIMNRVGFDINVIGNHEFDYGLSTLKERIEQAEFDFVCANVDVESSVLPQPSPYKTFNIGNVTITVLGLVETNGKPDDIIPSTHPWRVADVSFQRHSEVASKYADLKEKEDADVYLALTHIGSQSDFQLAKDHPYFDIIIGGHDNQIIGETVNGVQVYQSGSYISNLGKVELTIEDKIITEAKHTFIDLNAYKETDEELLQIIDNYNNTPQFDEVVGFADTHHNKSELGCFYTTALMEYMNTDASFQNGGGIRAEIDEGDITAMEIYNMDPFNNGSVVFTMTVAEIKDFFRETEAGLHVSGITLDDTGQDFIIYDKNGTELNDTETITIGINDYIPAVYEDYFPLEDADIKELTTAETIIQYLKNVNSTVDDEGCNRYFAYD